MSSFTETLSSGYSFPDPAITLGANDAQPGSTSEFRLTLRAQVRGQPVASWESPLKAATYHGVTVRRVANEWRADLLFDV